MDRLMADEARSAVLTSENRRFERAESESLAKPGWSVLTSGALEEGAAC
jgi:hypothetical protein